MNYPNIYTTVVFDIHPKIREYLEGLNQTKQIDLDSNGHPYLTSIERQGNNYVVKIIRNGKLENFLINPRKKAEPITSWNLNDGYKRINTETRSVKSSDGGKERERRKVYETIVKTIIGE